MLVVVAGVKELIAMGVRKLPSGCLRVLDIIEKVKGTKYPSVELQRLLDREPELKDQVQYEALPGQRTTPALKEEDVPSFLRALQIQPKLGRRPKTKPVPTLLCFVNVHNTQKVLTTKEGSETPYGWRYEIEGPAAPIRAEQSVIKYIRRLRAFKMRWVEIALQLQDDGIPLRPGWGVWTPEMVEWIFYFEDEKWWHAYETYWKKWRSWREEGGEE